MLTSKTVQQFLDETASSSPAPGGGSVSALAAALGAALTSMVCRLTIGKKKYADVQTELEDVLRQSEEYRQRFTALIDEDTQAFNKVMAAFALPKDSDELKRRRDAAIQEATKKATLVPLKLMEVCEQALQLAKVVAEKGNVNSVSDAGVAAKILMAGCEGAYLNVRINLANLTDESFSAQTFQQADGIARRVTTTTNEVVTVVQTKI